MVSLKTTKINKYPAHIMGVNRSELRKALMTILERDLRSVKKKRVLEIGCGSWDFAKKILDKNGCEWHGVEPVDMGGKNLTIVKGSVKDIPYHNNSFDIVLCNQTMEHWFEYNVSLNKALKEIHRVLKPGGVLMINAPIHKHGDPRFLKGELSKIRKVFIRKLWKLVLFERVFSVLKVQDWKRIASKGIFSKFGYPDFLIPNSAESTSYVLNIHAKKRGTRSIVKKSNAVLRNFVVLFMFIKTYLRTRLFQY